MAQAAADFGIEVWLALTPSLSFLTMTNRPSFRAEFKAGDGGKTAVYMTRWVNTRGEKGPRSEVTTATVAASVIDGGRGVLVAGGAGGEIGSRGSSWLTSCNHVVY
jgi:hypothetical protein